MSQERATNLGNQTEDAASPWKGLYRIGGIAALVATALFLVDIVVMTTLGTGPSTASDWFALLQDNRAVAMLQLFFTDLVGVALMAPIILALYMALRRTNAVHATLALALGFIGIALVLATNSNYALISLSNQYAAATTEAQRTLLLAAAEAALATGMGTGPLLAGFLLEAALLMLSLIMLRGNVFHKGIGYLGILAHGLDLAHAIIFLVLIPVAADAASAIGVPLLAIGGTLQLIWYPLVALRLLRLGRRTAVSVPGASWS